MKSFEQITKGLRKTLKSLEDRSSYLDTKRDEVLGEASRLTVIATDMSREQSQCEKLKNKIKDFIGE